MKDFFEKMNFSLKINPLEAKQAAEKLTELKELGIENKVMIGPRKFNDPSPRAQQLSGFAWMSMVIIMILTFGIIYTTLNDVIEVRWIVNLIRKLGVFWGLIITILSVFVFFMFIIFYGMHLYYNSQYTEGYYIEFIKYDEVTHLSIPTGQVRNLFEEYLTSLGLVFEGNDFSGHGVEGKILVHNDQLAIEYSGAKYETETLSNFMSSQFLDYLSIKDPEMSNILNTKLDEMERDPSTPEDQREQIGEARGALESIQNPNIPLYFYQKRGIITNEPQSFLSTYLYYLPKFENSPGLTVALYIMFSVLPVWMISMASVNNNHWYAFLLVPIIVVFYHHLRFGPRRKPLRVQLKYHFQSHYENIYWQIKLRQILGLEDYYHKTANKDATLVHFPNFKGFRENQSLFANQQYFIAVLSIPRSDYHKVALEVFDGLNALKTMSSEQSIMSTLFPTDTLSQKEISGYRAEEIKRYDDDTKSGKIKPLGNFWLYWIIFMLVMLLNFAVMSGGSVELQDMEHEDILTSSFIDGSFDISIEINETDRYHFVYSIQNSSLEYFRFELRYFVDGNEVHDHDGGRYGKDQSVISITDDWLLQKGSIVVIQSKTILPTLISISKGLSMDIDSVMLYANPLNAFLIFLSPLLWISRGSIYREYYYLPALYKKYLEENNVSKKSLDITITPIPIIGIVLVIFNAILTYIVIKGASLGISPFIEYQLFTFENYGLISFALINILIHIPYNWIYRTQLLSKRQNIQIMVIASIIQTITFSLLVPAFNEYMTFQFTKLTWWF